MRLRLNTTLRAALIAAITAVGVTLSQASAADQALLTTTFNVTGTDAGAWILTGTAAEGLNLSTSNPELVKLTNPTSLLGNKNSGGVGTAQLNPNTNVQTDKGWMLTFTVANNGNEAVTVDSMTVNSFLFNNGGAYQSNQTTRTFMLTMGGGEQTVSQEVTITGNSANNPPSGVITLKFGTAVTLDAGGSQTFSVKFDKASEALGCFVGVTSVTLNHTIVYPVSTWQGTVDNNNWTTSAGAWTPDFEDGNEVVFGTDASCKTVVLTAAVNTAKVTVEDNYTIDIQNGGSMSVGTDGIVISEDKTLSIANESGASYAVGAVSGAGDLALTAGAFTVGDYGSTGKLVVKDNGQLDLGDSRHTIATLEIGDGGVVTTTRNNGAGCVSGNININAGGVFKVAGGHDAFGYDTPTQNITLTGSAEKKAELKLEQTSDNSVTMKTNLKLMGHALVSTTKNGFNTFDCSIYAENTDNVIQKMQLRKDATIQVKDAGELSVGDMVYGNNDGNHNLTKTGEGTLTFTGTANMNSLTHNAGSVSFQGATTINGNLTMADGTTVTNSATLTFNNSGTIKIAQGGFSNSGTVNFSSSNVFDLSLLTDNDGVYTLFTGTDVDLSKYSFTANNITGVETIGKNWTFGNNGTISYTVSSSKIWTGDDGVGNWNYTEANWTDQQFAEGDIAEFRDYADVVVNAAVQAGGILVGEGSIVYLTNSEETPGTLSAASIDIAADAMLSSEISIGGVQNYSVGQDAWWAIGADQTLGAGTNNGTIYIVEGVTVTKTGTSAASDLSGFANDGGTLSVALTDATGGDDNIVTMLEVGEEMPSSGTFELRSGTIDYRSKLGDQTLKLGDGTRLLFGRANGDTTHTYAGDILVAGNASIRSHGTSQHPQVTISGDVTGTGTLTRENDGNQALNFTGTVNLGGYTNSDVQSGSSTDFQGDTTLGTLTADAGSTTKFSGSKADLGTMTVKGNAAVEINTTATISSMLDLSDGGKSSGTVTVKANKSLSIAEGATYWGGKNSSILMEEGGILNLAGMQIVGGAEIGAVVETTADNTQYGIGSASWSINGADITATKNINVGNELYFSTIDTGAFTVQLTNTENTLSGATVGTGGSLSMSGGTLFSVIESGGSVTLTGTTLDEESFIEQGGETGSHYDLNGQLTDGDNYYLGTSEKYLTVVNGGTSATGSGLTWGVKQNLTMTDGKVVTEAGEVVYETFYVNADSVNVSAITNTGTTGVQVAGGTLVVDKETSLNITVTDEGTISGDKADAKQVGIAEGATANYTGAVEDSGVRFSPGGDMSEVVIVNNGDATKTYSTTDKALAVAAQKLEMIDTQNNVTVSNTVVVDELVNITGKALTLDNTEALLLNSMTITGSTVEVVYTNEQMAPVEGTVMIAEALSAGGATLKADLTLYGGSTLDVDGGHVAGGAMNALTLGSTLTIDTTTGLVNLDQDTINALAGLSDGQYLDLIVAADQTKLKYGGSYEGVSYDTLFSATGLTGPYTVYANEGSFGLVKGSKVPEPTTGTLSLLALAALAARRRRK